MEQLVESVLTKVVEEFEHRIASQDEQVWYFSPLVMPLVIKLLSSYFMSFFTQFIRRNKILAEVDFYDMLCSLLFITT
jgi:hypothetical protein